MIATVLKVTPNKITPVQTNKGLVIQRKCNCGSNSKLGGQCEECKKYKLLRVQAKLHIGAANDVYEQEADRLADQIMRMPTNLDVSEPKEKNQDGYLKPVVQRKASNLYPGESIVPSSVNKAISSTGTSMNITTRSFMENRFGHDFSQVKIHTGSDADHSAKAINARAYTVGNNIVMARREYQSNSTAGKRLLAHELTHVIQQSPTKAMGVKTLSSVPGVFRKPATPDSTNDKPADADMPDTENVEHKDLTFLMDTQFESAALLFSTQAEIIVVSSPTEMITHLKNFNSPIRTVFILAHSTSTGDIKFDSTGWVSPNNLAMLIKSSLTNFHTPQTIDFRGCSIGMNPAGMESIRDALGAERVIGATCFMNICRTNSVQLGRPLIDITKRKQLKKAGFNDAFKKYFKQLPDLFGDAKACIINPTINGYFEAGGHLVSIYTTKSIGKPCANFSKTDSICYKNLPTKTINPVDIGNGNIASAGDCKLIQLDINAPLETSASPQTDATKGTSTTETATPNSNGEAE